MTLTPKILETVDPYIDLSAPELVVAAHNQLKSNDTRASAAVFIQTMLDTAFYQLQAAEDLELTADNDAYRAALSEINQLAIQAGIPETY